MGSCWLANNVSEGADYLNRSYTGEHEKLQYCDADSTKQTRLTVGDSVSTQILTGVEELKIVGSMIWEFSDDNFDELSAIASICMGNYQSEQV